MERCSRNHLLLNVNKTKEMVVDCRGTRTPAGSLNLFAKAGSVTGQNLETFEQEVTQQTALHHGQSSMTYYRERERSSFSSRLFHLYLSI